MFCDLSDIDLVRLLPLPQTKCAASARSFGMPNSSAITFAVPPGKMASAASVPTMTAGDFADRAVAAIGYHDIDTVRCRLGCHAACIPHLLVVDAAHSTSNS